jgi:hypothetical protein
VAECPERRFGALSSRLSAPVLRVARSASRLSVVTVADPGVLCPCRVDVRRAARPRASPPERALAAPPARRPPPRAHAIEARSSARSRAPGRSSHSARSRSPNPGGMTVLAADAVGISEDDARGLIFVLWRAGRTRAPHRRAAQRQRREHRQPLRSRPAPGPPTPGGARRLSDSLPDRPLTPNPPVGARVSSLMATLMRVLRQIARRAMTPRNTEPTIGVAGGGWKNR